MRLLKEVERFSEAGRNGIDSKVIFTVKAAKKVAMERRSA